MEKVFVVQQNDGILGAHSTKEKAEESIKKIAATFGNTLSYVIYFKILSFTIDGNTCYDIEALYVYNRFDGLTKFC